MLRAGRRLTAAALGAAFALAPLCAGSTAQTTDPRLVNLAQSSCGKPATPPHAAARLVAQAAPSPAASPADTPAANSSGAAATATPEAAATGISSIAPTNPAVPPPIRGPAVLVPPTPAPAGTQPATPPPLPSPTAPGTEQPLYLARPTGLPTILPAGSSPAPSATPAATRTLGPNEIVTIADRGTGSTLDNQPADLFGNVHIFYAEGQIVGDRAHFDGDHTMTLTGHTYLINRNQDAVLYAESITFDTLTHKATLLHGSGETTEGVDVGKLHYSAESLVSDDNGVTHGEHASFTTCENPRKGYHVEARTIDVYPGDRLIARKAVLFLGAIAVFYIPVLVVPLKTYRDERRQTTFFPEVGYDSVEGFWIKLRLGFAPSATYYGYYRIEYFTKRGLGIGYVAYIGAKDMHRYTTIDSYTIDDHVAGGRESNVNIQDVENFTRTLHGQFGLNYTGDYGAGISLPASFNLTGSLLHNGKIDTENFTFSRFLQGSLSDNLNLGFIESLQLGPNLTQQINLGYSVFNSNLSSSNTLHINTLTHLSTKDADFNLTYDKTDYSSNPFGYDTLPELDIIPKINFHNFKYPFQLQFSAGQYTEPQNHFSTERLQGVLNWPVYAKLGNSDFTASLNVLQDYYGTGDAKAYVTQNASLSTPLGNHFINSLTYNEQHPIGPANVPFQLLDRLSPAGKGAQDVFRFYNKDVWSLSLSSSTLFDGMAQPWQYQLTLAPTARSLLIVGGFWTPGPGQGFATTNLQSIVPIGPDLLAEFTTNVDWKHSGKLLDKNIYLDKIVGNCYELQFAYNEDLQQFTFNINLLAFPTRGAGFGIGGGQSPGIIPQGFTY